jgi:tetratricopeptide (TPR) repeat protein
MNTRQPTRWLSHCLLSATILLASPVLGLVESAIAADPFRSGQAARSLDTGTAEAFEMLFKTGDYPKARLLLQQARNTTTQPDPLTYAMLATFAYLDEDWKTFKTYGTRTRQVAAELSTNGTDPLRGNLYQAVGYFLEAAYVVSDAGEGLPGGLPTAFDNVQKVFSHLEKATDINPEDPELNLITGYIELLLANEVALVSPQQAINKLQNYAAPSYLSLRGVALAYRDHGSQEQALAAVNQALEDAPTNPELFYLKAQILRKQGKLAASRQFFDGALAQKDRLPAGLVKQMTRERSKL